MAGAGATTLASAHGSPTKEGAGETIVARSVSGKRWRLRAADERLGLALAQTLGVPEIVGRLLAGRGIGIDEAPDYLNPTLRAALPDPSHLLDMDKAVERLCRAIRDARIHRRVRRLRRGRRHLERAAAPVPARLRAGADHLHSRPHEGRLRPERPGDAGPGQAGRQDRRHGRLRHHGARTAGDRGGRRARRHRRRPPRGRAEAAARLRGDQSKPAR